MWSEIVMEAMCLEGMEVGQLPDKSELGGGMAMRCIEWMRMDNLYPVHIVTMDKHRYAYLIGSKQS